MTTPRPLWVPVLLSLSLSLCLCLGPACSGDAPEEVAIGERALVVDDDGATHVAWVDRESGTILYGTNASGGWVTETVDTFTPPQAPGGAVSIDLDEDGAPRVQYLDAADGTPRAATRQRAGLWVSVPRVDPASRAGADQAGRSTRPVAWRAKRPSSRGCTGSSLPHGQPPKRVSR